jgi:hypothetical protein
MILQLNCYVKIPMEIRISNGSMEFKHEMMSVHEITFENQLREPPIFS